VGQSERGRLVWNHSTHIPGLIPLLETLLAQESAIQTVTPGVISTVRSHAPQFRLKVSVPIRGGYKLIARRGKSAQEVFVVTTLDQGDLEAAIAQAIQAQRRL
jgi:hypothetical protein